MAAQDSGAGGLGRFSPEGVGGGVGLTAFSGSVYVVLLKWLSVLFFVCVGQRLGVFGGCLFIKWWVGIVGCYLVMLCFASGAGGGEGVCCVCWGGSCSFV